MKKCSSCLEEKHIHEFHKNKERKDGLNCKCKICVKLKNKSPRLGMVKHYEPIGELMCCRACKVEKDICYFPFNNQRNKRYSKCNVCINKKVPLLKEDIKEKICKTCNILQTTDNFYKNENRYFSSCKLCTLKNRKNKPKNYYRNNKKKIAAYNKKRRRDNYLVLLKETIASSIYKSIKQNNFYKKKKTVDILGCTVDEFRKHIEKQFENWMSWDNYGNLCETLEPNCSWDLDHIIPISSAKNEEEIYALNHWSNFQPLCSYINRNIKRNNIYPVTNLELKITKI